MRRLIVAILCSFVAAAVTLLQTAQAPSSGADVRKEISSAHGGAERNRTADLLIANEALSQLSYSPMRTGARQAVDSPPARRQAL